MRMYIFRTDAAEACRRSRKLLPVGAKLPRKDSSQCIKTGRSRSYATECKASSAYVSRLRLDCFEKTCEALSADAFRDHGIIELDNAESRNRIRNTFHQSGKQRTQQIHILILGSKVAPSVLNTDLTVLRRRNPTIKVALRPFVVTIGQGRSGRRAGVAQKQGCLLVISLPLDRYFPDEEPQ